MSDNPIIQHVIFDPPKPIAIRHSVANAIILPILNATSLDHVIISAHSAADTLVRLGIATSCNIILDSTDNHNSIVILKPVPASRIIAKAGTHIGASDGSMTASLKLANIFGGGESFEANASYGVDSSIPFSSNEIYSANIGKTYQAHLSSPFLLDPDTNISLSLQNQIKDHSATQSHLENSTTASIKLKLLNRISGNHELSYDCSFRQISNVHENASWGIRQDAGHHMKSALTYSLQKDTRDDYLLPTSGFLVKAFAELAGLGGTAKHAKYDLDLQKTFPLGDPSSGFMLQTSFRQGSILPWSYLGWTSSSSTPSSYRSIITDKFLLGGPLSIRGFHHQGLAPGDGKDRLGGDAYWAAGLSLLTPIPFVGRQAPIKMHFFANSGKLISFDLQQNLKDLFHTPSISVGLGCLIRFNILRAEVNYAVPIALHTNDLGKPGLQFGIGLHFL